MSERVKWHVNCEVADEVAEDLLRRAIAERDDCREQVRELLAFFKVGGGCKWCFQLAYRGDAQYQPHQAHCPVGRIEAQHGEAAQ